MNVLAKIAYVLVALLVAVLVGTLAGPGMERWIGFGIMVIVAAALAGLTFRRIDRTWPPPKAGNSSLDE